MQMEDRNTDDLSSGLWRSLYGHPEAGSHWERHLEKELLAMSATKISEFSIHIYF